jgi:hypothetical protein
MAVDLSRAILAAMSREEPFFVLVNEVDWHDSDQLDKFVRTLCDMVSSGLLTVDVWGVRHWVEPGFKGSLLEEMQAYVDKRRRLGEKLDEVPDGEYNFHLTAAGEKIIVDEGL